MKRFRRQSVRDQDLSAVNNLVPLLKQHGEHILNGKITLCLTAPVVVSLNRIFVTLTDGTSLPTFQVSPGKGKDHNVGFVFDFVQKAVSVKIVSGPVCAPSPLLDVKYFKALQSLEIRKVPIGHIRGLPLIRRQLRSLVCSRSTNSLKNVLVCFAKDESGAFMLPELTILDVSYNTINAIDDSLSLLPALQSLNLSHNCLTNLETEDFPPVYYLNIGYNALRNIPRFPQALCNSLTNLVLRNNNLSSLNGVQFLVNLKSLDVAANCIAVFSDLEPLATLHFLTKIILKGNPLSYASDYRHEAISRFSPMVRQELVFLDDKALDHNEVLCLGKLVEPVSLRAYIPDEPIGRPPGSLRDLANSLTELSFPSPTDASTPLDGNNGKKIQRRVRDAFIVDPASLPSRHNSFSKAVVSRLQRSDSRSKGSNSGSNPASRSSSKRSSIDGRISMKSPEVDQQSALTREWSSLDYASFPDKQEEGPASEPSSFRYENANHAIEELAHASMENDIGPSPASAMILSRQDSVSTSDGAAGNDLMEDNEDDTDDFEVVYLVERLSEHDTEAEREKESLFVIVHGAVLIEKEILKAKVVERLDLHYLVSVKSSSQLDVELQFDLMKLDRRKRDYRFDCAENVKSFCDALKPFVKANLSRQQEAAQKYQCLKCSAVFPSDQHVTLCISCGSSMIVEYFERDIVHENTPSLTANSYGKTTSASSNLNGEATATSQFAHDLEQMPSILPDGDERRAVSSLSDSLDRHSIDSKPVTPKSVTSRSLGDESKLDVGSHTVYTSLLPVNDVDPEENSSEKSSFVSTLVSAMRNKSFSPKRKSPIGSSSYDASPGKGSFEARIPSPGSSFGTKLSGARVSNGSTPFLNSTSDVLYINKDEFYKCDHRLMLYFDMEFFDDKDEEFACMIQSEVVRFGVAEPWDGILLLSTRHIFILRLRTSPSDSPKDWIKRMDKFNYQDIRFFDIGYFKQSFQVELSRPVDKYKFLVKDAERCEKFFAAFLRCFEDALRSAVITKSLFPVVSEEPNPQTVTNIKQCLFGFEEDLFERGRRIFEQVNVYTYPSLIQNRKMRIRTHAQCLVSKEFVDWLVTRREVESRDKAVSLCQSLLDVGIIFHVSKEDKFSYSDALYKFNLNEDHRKFKSLPTRENGYVYISHDDGFDQSLDSDVDTTVCLYITCLCMVIDQDEHRMKPRSICMTRSHLMLVNECHQWPLPRTIGEAVVPKLPQMEKCTSQLLTNITKFVFFEDKPNMVSINYIDEENPSKEITWFVATETVRSLTRLTTAIKTIWEGKFEVELGSEVLPSSDKYLLP